MLKKVIKAALIFGAVGVVLGLVAPAIATFAVAHLGLAPAIAAPIITNSSFLWEGLFFGAFGAVNAVLDPIMNGIFGVIGFGDKKKGQEVQHETQVHRSHTITRSQHHSADMAVETDQAPSTKHQDRVGASRPNDMSFQQKVDASRANAAEHAV